MTSEFQIASNILTKAITLDGKKRYTEALICYQEGLQILMALMPNMPNADEKNKLRVKITDYMGRAEKIKKHVETEKSQSTYHEQIIIENDSTGHSYQSIFARFLDNTVTVIEIDDPYVRVFHQCQNLLRFCELVVQSCENLKTIVLTTISHGNDQDQWLNQLQTELIRYKVTLKIVYSPTLHDREIRLDNGWIIKIGRGLDYFKGPEGKFALGVFDMNLRKCHETTVDIFHNKSTRIRYG